jgi:hypothetical protein
LFKESATLNNDEQHHESYEEILNQDNCGEGKPNKEEDKADQPIASDRPMISNPEVNQFHDQNGLYGGKLHMNQHTASESHQKSYDKVNHIQGENGSKPSPFEESKEPKGQENLGKDQSKSLNVIDDPNIQIPSQSPMNDGFSPINGLQISNINVDMANKLSKHIPPQSNYQVRIIIYE